MKPADRPSKQPRLPAIAAGERKVLLVRLILNGAAQAGAALAIALLGRMALSLYGENDAVSLSDWLPPVGGLVAAGLLVMFFRIIERVDAERLGQGYVATVRDQLFASIAGAPISARRKSRFGVTITRMVTDLSAVRNWVRDGVARLTVSVIAMGGALGAMAIIDPTIAVIAAAAVTLSFIVVMAVTRPMRRRVREVRRQRGRLAANVAEKALAAITVQQFDRIRTERRRIRRQSRQLTRSAVKLAWYSGLLRAMPDAILPLVAASVVGTSLLSSSGSATGELAFSLLLIGLMASPLRGAMRAWDYRLSFLEARRRLLVVLALPQIKKRSKRPSIAINEPLALAVEELSLKGTLQGVSLNMPPGQVVALAGPSGAGKTTLLAIVAGLMGADSGRILVDGRPLNRVRLGALRAAVKLTSPVLPLLRGTVAENIAYGKHHGSEYLDAVAALCYLNGDEALPQGLNTLVDEGGTNLSSGVVARIALARALVTKPAILLVDDPAFERDTRALEALRRIAERREFTILMVANQPALQSVADRVIRLERGQIVKTNVSDAIGSVTALRKLTSS